MADARWKMANDKSASKFASSFLSPFLLILARRRNSFISMQVHASPDPEETQRPKGRNEPKVEKLFIFFIFLILLCCCCWCCCSETSNYIHDLHTETHTHTRAHTHICEHVEGPREQCTARNLCVHRYPSWLGNSRYSFPFLWPQVCPLHLYQNCF